MALAAQLLMGASMFKHVTPVLQELHKLPVFCHQFKVVALTDPNLKLYRDL